MESDYAPLLHLEDIKRILEGEELETPDLLKIHGFVDSFLNFLERVYPQERTKEEENKYQENLENKGGSLEEKEKKE